MPQQPPIRIPTLPIGQMVKEDGTPTEEELTFRQNLVSNLQSIAGNEGLVAPTQTTANILVIQNNQLPNGEYTCQFGTIIYDVTTRELKVAVDDGAGAPLFKVVTLV